MWDNSSKANAGLISFSSYIFSAISFKKLAFALAAPVVPGNVL
ncbi:MAG: hypothetical protein CM15mP58_14130 [Burkholderiaceae bacterium]|nr:MAG: hypothetical protein CM15mP58_14130 [Burkholderiaceae bacterium]